MIVRMVDGRTLAQRISTSDGHNPDGESCEEAGKAALEAAAGIMEAQSSAEKADDSQGNGGGGEQGSRSSPSLPRFSSPMQTSASPANREGEKTQFRMNASLRFNFAKI